MGRSSTGSRDSSCRSTPYGDAEVTVDVNVDVYPIEVGTKFTYVLASTLNTDGSPEDPTTFDQTGKESLADEYEYVDAREVLQKDRTERRCRRERKDGDVYLFRRLADVLENRRESHERSGRRRSRVLLDEEDYAKGKITATTTETTTTLLLIIILTTTPDLSDRDICNMP